MENDDIEAQQENGTKRKTQIQLQSLEKFFLEEKYPKRKEMEDYATSLKLTYNQVRIWFSDRRRKEKKENESPTSCGKNFPSVSRVQAPNWSTGNGKRTSYGPSGGKTQAKSKFNGANKKRSLGQREIKAWTSLKCNHAQRSTLSLSKKDYDSLHIGNKCLGLKNNQRALGRQMKNSAIGIKKLQKKPLVRLQVLFPKDYILKRVFRKDGPPLGVEFDSLPARAFGFRTGSNNSPRSCQDSKRIPKKRKVSETSMLDSRTLHSRNAPVKRYGIGKGLMTVWRATNPDSGSCPAGINSIDKNVAHMCLNETSKELLHRESKRPQHRKLVTIKRTLRNKSQEKKKAPMKKRKVLCTKDANLKMPHMVECKLAFDDMRSQEQANSPMVLMDDEELELSELQAGPNPPRCSTHLASNGRNGCPLCKDMLARFPPPSVKMKQPMCTRPWDSSPEIVKKLFKVFRFLYAHAVTIDICPFTLDEFAQAFHDKDSMLLGKIHVAVLNLLLSDVEREISAGFLPRASKDCRFLGFLHSVRHQEFDVNFWIQSLNPLTWTEILRQVLIAAGFGSKQNSMRKGTLNKEGNHMAKYGLRPRTLKGELFNILSKQGSSGSKVSELAKASQIVALDLPNTTAELEPLICSTLSSDITLFEKIAPSAYRLRASPLNKKGIEDSQSDTEDSASIDDDSGDTSSSSSSDESCNLEGLDSVICEKRIVRYRGCRKRQRQRMTQFTEIDESFSGEAWVLGLMEGEYSDLSIEEKLDALIALIDLTGSGSSLRMEEPVRAISAIVPDTTYRGSGAKIKKSSTSQNTLLRPLWLGYMVGAEEPHSSLDLPVDSSAIGSKSSNEGYLSGNRTEYCGPPVGFRTKNPEAVEESGSGVHPLKSIHLGYDRRYNSYWLFLGPCNTSDPGHRRIYFESSEDGHWEVIDTEQALSALLLVLDCRGTREARLLASLEKREAFLCRAMAEYAATEIGTTQINTSHPSDTDVTSGNSSSPVSDIDNNIVPEETTYNYMPSSGAIVLEFGKNCEEKRQKWDRLQSFDKWIWKSFYCNLNAVKHSKKSYLESLTRCESCHDLYWRDEKHCRICHTTFELDFDLEERYAIHVATCRETEDSGIFPNHKVLSSQLQALKATVHAIEAGMPEEALVGFWTRSAHKLWIKRLRRTSSMPELLQVVADFVGAINEEWLYECALALGCNTALDDIVVLFQTMPQTTSAVALWMVKLDTLLAPHLQRLQSQKEPGIMTQEGVLVPDVHSIDWLSIKTIIFLCMTLAESVGQILVNLLSRHLKD